MIEYRGALADQPNLPDLSTTIQENELESFFTDSENFDPKLIWVVLPRIVHHLSEEKFQNTLEGIGRFLVDPYFHGRQSTNPELCRRVTLINAFAEDNPDYQTTTGRSLRLSDYLEPLIRGAQRNVVPINWEQDPHSYLGHWHREVTLRTV